MRKVSKSVVANSWKGDSTNGAIGFDFFSDALFSTMKVIQRW